MKHRGKASQAGLRLVLWTLAVLVLVIVGGVLAMLLGSLIASAAIALLVLWVVFAGFTLFFFRDPDPRVPPTPEAIVAPAHGKVDLIDETVEAEFMGEACRRISIFLSVMDVHVQNAPVAGTITFMKRTEGKFINALKAESAVHNENALIGIESSERAGEKVAVRLIAGLIARRIVPFVDLRDVVERGERISLIQFGSRCDLYLPLAMKIEIKVGDHVRGGQTVVATRTTPTP
jgi:phosphatidylserine decarboxylase